jgi:hypothetical protein
MPYKRRHGPTEREPKISARAIEIFDAMRRVNGDRWWDLHAELSVELKTKPWAYPCVQSPNEPNPYPPGTAAHLSWRPDAEAVALWQALAQASREARAVRNGGGLPATAE